MTINPNDVRYLLKTKSGAQYTGTLTINNDKGVQLNGPHGVWIDRADIRVLAPLDDVVKKPIAIRVPPRSLARLYRFVQDMNAEDAKPARARDSRVYAAGMAVVETFGLMLGVSDPSDIAAVAVAMHDAVDEKLEA